MSSISVPSGNIAPSSRATTPPTVLFYYLDFGVFGGIERFIERITLCLQHNHRFRPVVVCSAGTRLYEACQVSGVTTYGIETHPVFAKSTFRLFDFISLTAFLKIVKKENPVLLHLHVGFLEHLLLLFLPATRSIPKVYTFHGYGSLYNLEATESPLKRFIKKLFQPTFRYFFNRLNKVMFVSSAEQQRLVKAGYLCSHQANAVVVHNGVDVPALQARSNEATRSHYRQLWGISSKGYCIGYISRLDENKNPLYFLSVLEDFFNGENTGQERHAVVVGTGPLAQSVQQCITRSAYSKFIHYLGQRDDIPEILSALDCVVHVPTNEGFGLAVLEAMSVGTPVIAHQVGGIPEVMPPSLLSNLLVPLLDKSSLVKQLRWLQHLPDQEKTILKQNLMTHARQFELSQCVINVETIYKEVLSHSYVGNS